MTVCAGFARIMSQGAMSLGLVDNPVDSGVAYGV
jgi:hypothetical protein